MSKDLIVLPKHLLCEKIVVAIVQINFRLDEKGNPTHYGYKKLEDLDDKLAFLLNNIKETIPRPDIVIFPEYSIPRERLELLEKFAIQNSILIIAGSHHDPETLENVCPVIIPGMQTQYCKKKFVNYTERYVKSSNEAGKIFVWKVDNNEFSFQVFLCSDYLHTSLRREINIDADRTGLIIVPMNTANIVDYYNLANLHLMDAKGKLIFLCNACGVTIKQRLRACGQSAIFGSYDNARRYFPVNGGKKQYASSLGELEGLILSEIDLLEPVIVKRQRTSFSTRIFRPPVRILSVKILKEQKQAVNNCKLGS